MAQGVSQTWNALYAALQQMFPQDGSQIVVAGDPGDYQPDLIIAMRQMRAPITQPTGGANRSRDKRISIDIDVSAFAAGGEEVQAAANAAAWAAADQIEAYFRVSPNERLGGACYNAFAESEEMTPATAWQQIEGLDPAPVGRVADIAMVVQACIRI